MRVTRNILALSLTVLAAACGGGGGSSPTPTNPPVIAPEAMPEALSLPPSGQVRLMAEGTAPFTWTATAGSVDADGLFTAPATTGACDVRVANSANPNAPATIRVEVEGEDAGNLVIGSSLRIWPTAMILPAGKSAWLLAKVKDVPTEDLTWRVIEPGGGALGSPASFGPYQAVQYKAPLDGGVFHVELSSRNRPDLAVRCQVTVRSTGQVAVSVIPASASLRVGQTASFRAMVSGSSNKSITWSVAETGGGTVSATGLYTAPATEGIYHVRATSVADTTKSATATVTVTAVPVVNVSIVPASASLQTGQTQSFTATVTGTSNTAVTWSVVESGGGTVSAAGLYTAPGTAGTYHVRATSVADPTKSATATVTVTAPPATSGYLLLTAARLAQIRADANAGGPAWTELRANVESQLASTDPYSTGAENMALAYLVSGDPRYAARAYWWAQQLMAMPLSRDSYYDFGEILQGVALVLNYCAPALSPAQAATLADYLEAAADELWFHPSGSGWGLDNPRNNYHHTFILGTACAGYALQARGDARAARWIAKVQDLLERPDGVMAYLSAGVPGGDWDEGMNYAQGSIMHLGRALAIIAAAGGRNYFTAAPFFQNHPRFTLYACQPGGSSLYPGGDLAWDSSMPVSPFRRAMLQPILAWLPDSTERRLGQWFLNHVIPSYLDGGRTFNWRTALFLEVIFALPQAETDPAGQTLSYRTPTTNWINLRSGWDAQATSLSISGSPRMLESHQHADTGSFTLWKQGWQAVDASTFSHSGLLAVPEAHNLLRVPNRYSGVYADGALVPGATRFEDSATHGYVQVDATRLYRRVVSSSDIRDLLNEHTREFMYLRPNTLVLFDRVDAQSDAAGYAWCLHFPAAPSFSAGRYSAAFEGGGMSLVQLLGGSSSVVPDADLEAGTRSVRVEEAATGLASRFLNVLEVGSGAAPSTTAQLVSTPGSVQGALVGSTVVLFSDRPRGLSPVLPFSYTVPGTASLTHLLCNMDAPVSVQLVAAGGNTVVTVSAGSSYSPTAQGLIRFTAAPGAAISVVVSPASASLQTGQTRSFTATVTGTANTAVTWSVVDAGGGTVSAAGLYTAPATAGTYHVRATSVADPTKRATATVTVTAPPVVNVAIAPASASLQTGQVQAFTATVTGTSNTAVTWGVVETGGGTVSAAGLYTAPATAGTYHVRATSVADPTKSATATVTVTAAPPAGPCNAADLGPGASLRGYRPFPADNPWNQDISGAPVDPNSAAIIAFIGATRGLKADFGAGLWEGAPIGIPYQVVNSAQAKVRINFTAYGDESDPGPMPIPSTAPIEGGSASTGDRHVLVLDRDACLLYELYRAFPQADGSWNADSTAVWDLRSNNLRPFGWTSSDAAGLPVFPGLARYDEVAAGEITHALRFTVPTTRRAYVLPATHWASSNTSASAPPMGMRVRLKAGVDISGYGAQAQVVLRALKKYGMILADNGSAWYISGAPDERWINSQLAALGNIKGSDLEVVQMGTVHTSDPTGAAPAISAFTASPATISAGGTSTLSWSATNATRTFVTPEIGWAGGTSVSVRPTATTTYTLTAEGPYGSTTRTVTVTVASAPQPPVISSFTASPASISAGASTTLSWSVSGATSLSINQGIGTVTGTNRTVSPTATTTFTLTATNAAGGSTATATVTVTGQPSQVRIGYLHHSTGGNIWNGGVPQAFTAYNAARGTNYQISARTYPDTGGGYPWANYPYDYYNLWVRHTGTSQDRGELNLDQLAALYDVVVFKHCYPVCEILADTGSPSLDSTRKSLENYRLQYAALKTRMRAFPAKKFIVWTGAVDQRGGSYDETTGEPQRARAFWDWVKTTWDEPGDNIFLWDFAQLETEGTYYNRYPAAAGDNHPNALVSGMVAPYLAFRIIDVVEGRGDSGDPTGRTAGANPPQITTITASPTSLSGPGSSTLAWTVSGSTRVALDQLIGPVTGTSRNVNLTATTTYSLTATNASGSASRSVTVAVGSNPSVSITSFTATPAAISTGQSSTLAWSVTGATTLSIDRGIGTVTGSSVSVSPTATTTYTLTATGAGGSMTAAATVTVTTGGAPADVTISIDPASTQPISPWIYGTNFYGSINGAPPGLTLNRMGGNRWTAYNWENNASNAGSDWGPYSNDAYLGGGSTPAEAVRSVIAADQGRGMASLMTIQLQGYVSADKNGLVNISDPNHLTDRFKQAVFKKGSAFTSTPSSADGSVFMDEFLWALRAKFSGDIFAATAPLPTFVSLDNEPELWGDTHAEIQTGRITPSAYIQKTIDLAKALKDVAPDVQLFGPVHYGFNGIVNWQGSAGFTSSYWFTDKYLQELKIASDAYGKRLLDAYDLHWYSEATGEGTRIVNLSGANLTASQAQAIVQSPRSLWDPTYTENSWVAQYLGQPVNLLGRIKAKIAASWPGTKIALTEYGNGGDNHIAGAVAQADNLGIFGAQGVFAATLWPLNDCPFILAGFRAFRGFDGAAAHFGDISVKATSSNIQNIAAYVSHDSNMPGRVVIVALNRSTVSQTVAFQGQPLAGTARIYQITAQSAQAQRTAAQPVAPVAIGQVPVSGASWTVALPPMSVTTVEIK